MDHSNNDCFLMVVMTHGHFGTISSFDESYRVEKIFSYFTDENCPTLKGKPRLFFIQACRGSKQKAGFVLERDIESEIYNLDRHLKSSDCDTTTTFIEPELVDILHEPMNHPDFLIVRSTMPNYVSFRDREEGTWFIQSLCRELNTNGKRESLLTLLTHVNMDVASCESESNKFKQIPTVSTMLTKILIFNDKTRENLVVQKN